MFPVNLPNLLTVLRIMLVPVLVVALLGNTPDGDVLAAVVFALASLTDLVDGYLARSRGSVTNFGKLMDPLADKLLIIAALISLVSLHRVAAWVAMVIIARELAVTVLRLGATQSPVGLPRPLDPLRFLQRPLLLTAEARQSALQAGQLLGGQVAFARRALAGRAAEGQDVEHPPQGLGNLLLAAGRLADLVRLKLSAGGPHLPTGGQAARFLDLDA